MPRVIEIPELSVIVLIGASGSGKSTFARAHFRASEILSSDAFRASVADDESDQSVTQDAFEALYFIAEKRLRHSKLCVIDATNVRPQDRAGYVELARRNHVAAVAIVFAPVAEICLTRNSRRSNRTVAEHVVHAQIASLKQDLDGLKAEGFAQIHTVNLGADEDAVEIIRQPLATNKRNEHGPFDIVGDVHGCYEEMTELLEALGYARGTLDEEDPIWGAYTWRHPGGRRAVFIGDLADRGPRILDTIRGVRNMVASGAAFLVPGNHDVKFARWLRGEAVTAAHGLERSIEEFYALRQEIREQAAVEYAEFLDILSSHYVLDGGKLVVVHAGLREELQGRSSETVREIAIFGKLRGESYDRHWADKYRGRAMVVYGHIPVTDASWVNGTINIDTGCVFGGRLTALRYPECELVSIPARREYDTFVPPTVL